MKGFKSRKTFANQTSKARKALPGDPLQYASIVEKLVTGASPSKKKALGKVDLFKKNDLGEKLVHAVKLLPTSVTKAAMGVLKKYASQRFLSKEMKVNRKTIARACLRGGKRKPKKQQVDPSTISSFYKREDISRQMPGKRFARKEGPGYFMQISLRAAFSVWKKENPAVKIGFTKFTLLRPRNVRLLSKAHRDFCLCPHCLNIKYKLLAINRVARTDLKIEDENALVDILLCPKSDGQRFHAPGCVSANCQKCKDYQKTLKCHYKDLDQGQTVTWNHWERGVSQGKVRRMLVTRTATVGDLVEEFCKDVTSPTQGCSFVSHLFTAHWQQKQYLNLKNDLPQGWILTIMDFAKNRPVHFQDEIKEAFFAQQQITVHPIVSYYKNEEDKLVRDLLICISDDRNHDYHAVKHFSDLNVRRLKQTVINVERMVIFSDGCSAQYKGKGSFADLSLESMLIDRNFYGSEHGKGESDGETGVLNRALDRAIVGRQVIIRDGKEMFEWCEESLTLDESLNKRHFAYIAAGEISRDRPYTNVNTLNGCRKIHQATNDLQQSYKVRVRSLTCFCSACRGKGGKCVNQDYVSPFMTKTLKMKATDDVEVLSEPELEEDLLEKALADILEDADSLGLAECSESWTVSFSDNANDSVPGDLDRVPTCRNDKSSPDGTDGGQTKRDRSKSHMDTSSVNLTAGNYFKVQHGSEVYPAVVVDTPPSYDDPPEETFWAHYFHPSGAYWAMDETCHLIPVMEVAAHLKAPDIIMQGRRFLYNFEL